MANLNGKKGSQKHQDVQKEVFEKTTSEYDDQPNIKVEMEVPISTPNGKKKGRVADVAAFSKQKPLQFFKILQVGKTESDGKPVKREQEAIEDIESHLDIRVSFVDYEKYILNHGKAN
ncbi:MAG: hypothetical protein EAZ97_11190 [Bacteroidetes bacterium]|nr:MAG: hypothetical protein EAZ97_11190 [Bacteroidota bacterium]